MPPDYPIGLPVFLRIGGDDKAPIYRPAIVVSNADGKVNLQVFSDGDGDRELLWKAEVIALEHAPVPPLFHVRDVVEGFTPGTFRLAPPD